MQKESKATRRAHIVSQMAKTYSSGSPLVRQVLQLLDAESVASVPGILRSHQVQAAAIHSDRDLSDEGKRSRVKASADSRLGNLGSLAKKFADLETQHRKEQAEAVPVPRPTDPWEIQLDFEIARHVRETGLKPFHLTTLGVGEVDQRMREAIARVPASLTGLTEEQRSLVHGSLRSPKDAARLSEEAQVLTSARKVVQEGLYELGADARWSTREWVDHVGPAWNLPGVAQSQADRMAEGGPEHAWEALPAD